MSCFYTIISLGPVGLWALTNIVQVCNSYIIFSNFIILSTSIIFSTSIISSTSTCQAASFHEVMHLGHLTTGVPGLSTWSWLLLLTANLYWVDPLLLPIPHNTVLPLCFTLYLMLITHFVMSIRHTSQCLPRYSVGSLHSSPLPPDQVLPPGLGSHGSPLPHHPGRHDQPHPQV